jgi:hypothetical protein
MLDLFPLAVSAITPFSLMPKGSFLEAALATIEKANCICLCGLYPQQTIRPKRPDFQTDIISHPSVERPKSRQRSIEKHFPKSSGDGLSKLIAAAILTAMVDQMQTVPAELGPALGTCRSPRQL